MSKEKNIKKEDVKKVLRRAVFPLKEGDVTVTVPDRISESSLVDLAGYLKLTLEVLAEKKKG